MDKITKNPTNAKLTDSPRTSNADSQIEKYRIEISKKSESDFINARKLTIQSTVKHETPPESNEIDKQISDLESLIKRLQDEIIEMSNNADKPYLLPDEDDDTDDTTVETADDQPVESEQESHEPNKTVDVTDKSGTTSHVYPVILRDVGLSLDDQSEQFADKVSDLVNYSGEKPVENIPETFSSIRKNVDILWDEDNLDDEDPSERKAAHENYHLNKLIGELKTEISEKLETLKDVSNGEPLNNSEENINQSAEALKDVSNRELFNNSEENFNPYSQEINENLEDMTD